jgi:large subunit ribosomal protein L9
MQVILLQDVDKLGTEGEVVTVKDGYGRNFLIPRGLARVATQGAVKARQEELRQQTRKRAQERDRAQQAKEQLEGLELVVTAKVGEENRIFGTITPQQVAVKLAERGFTIDRRHIELGEEIRVIGVYTAYVRLQPDIVAQLKVRVEPEGAEA